MGMLPWLHILGGDCKMDGDDCGGLDTVWETRRRAGDFGMAEKVKKKICQFFLSPLSFFKPTDLIRNPSVG
jgi:hypothetical protein